MISSDEPRKQEPEDEKLQIKNNQLGLASQVVASTTDDEGTTIVLCCSCGKTSGSATIQQEEDVKL